MTHPFYPAVNPVGDISDFLKYHQRTTRIPDLPVAWFDRYPENPGKEGLDNYVVDIKQNIDQGLDMVNGLYQQP